VRRFRIVGLLFLALLASAAARADEMLRIGMSALSASYGNPFTTFSAPSSYLWSAMFDTLTINDNRTGENKPWLATKVEQIEPLVWRAHLREGVKFANGTPFDANAVVATLNFLKTEAAKPFRVAGEFARTKEARAIDARTVDFVLEQPDPLYPRLLSLLAIVEPEQLAKLGIDGFARQPIGTGPYVLQRFENDRAVFIANPHAWAKPPSAKLEIIAVADATARLQAVLSGAMDVTVAIEPGDVELIKSVNGQVIGAGPTGSLLVILQQTRGSQPALKDARVRRALNYAVNRQAIVDVILAGQTKIASQFAASILLGHDPETEPYPYDPAKAKALLAEAGYPNGFSFSLETIVGVGMGDAVVFQQIAADLAQIGVTMRIDPIPMATFSRNIVSGGWKADAYTFQYSSDATMDALWSMRFFSCLVPSSAICDREIQPLIDQAFAAPDLAAREALARQVMRAYHEKAYAIYMHETTRLIGVGPRVAKFGATSTRLRWDEMEMQ
jgi:peptide/nickel transport system substrate-binding protein